MSREDEALKRVDGGIWSAAVEELSGRNYVPVSP